MKEQIMKFIRDEEGLTMVEYAIAGSLVGLACVIAFTTLGNNIGTRVDEMADVVLNGAP
jgi:pilus assembly protein Flp/PilA